MCSSDLKWFLFHIFFIISYFSLIFRIPFRIGSEMGHFVYHFVWYDRSRCHFPEPNEKRFPPSGGWNPSSARGIPAAFRYSLQLPLHSLAVRCLLVFPSGCLQPRIRQNGTNGLLISSLNLALKIVKPKLPEPSRTSRPRPAKPVTEPRPNSNPW